MSLLDFEARSERVRERGGGSIAGGSWDRKLVSSSVDCTRVFSFDQACAQSFLKLVLKKPISALEGSSLSSFGLTSLVVRQDCYATMLIEACFRYETLWDSGCLDMAPSILELSVPSSLG